MLFVHKCAFAFISLLLSQINFYNCKWTAESLLNYSQNATIVDPSNYLLLDKNLTIKNEIFSQIEEIKSNNYFIYSYVIDSIDDNYMQDFVITTRKNSAQFLRDLINNLSRKFNLKIDKIIVILVAIEDSIYDIFFGDYVNLKGHFYYYLLADEKNKITGGLIDEAKKKSDYAEGLLSILKEIKMMINYNLMSTGKQMTVLGGIILVIALIIIIFKWYKERCNDDYQDLTDHVEIPLEIKKDYSILNEKYKNIKKYKSIENYIKENCVICLETLNSDKHVNLDRFEDKTEKSNQIDYDCTDIELYAPLIEDNMLSAMGMQYIENLKRTNERPELINEVIYINCGHKFHRKCMKSNLEMMSKCPICSEKMIYFVNSSELFNNNNLQKSLYYKNVLSNQRLDKNSNLSFFLIKIQKSIKMTEAI